jgi:hypothetical protein
MQPLIDPPHLKPHRADAQIQSVHAGFVAVTLRKKLAGKLSIRLKGALIP